MANTVTFIGILQKEMARRSIPLAILLMISLIFLVFEIVQCKRNRAQGKTGKHRSIIVSIALVAWVCLNFYFDVIPVINDIAKESFVCVDGLYCAGPVEKETLLRSAFVSIETDEGEVWLKIPRGEQKTFPEGDCSGTFWYAYNSEVLLMIETEDGNIYFP